MKEGSCSRIPSITWQDFMMNTNIIGLTNAGQAKTGLRKTLWLVVFVGFVVITLFFLYQLLFINFYSFSTQFTVTTQDTIYFPAVTFCNHNRVRCSELLKMTTSCKETPAPDTCPGLNVTSLENLYRTVCEPPPTNGARKKRSGNNQQQQQQQQVTPAATTQENEFLTLYMNTSESVRRDLGHQLFGLLQACTFKAKDCRNETFFAMTQSPTFGNCFIFNLQNNTNDEYSGNRVVSQTGPSFGLSLVLNLEQNDYMTRGFTQSAGARVAITSGDDIALPDEFGMDIHPATANNFGLQQVNYSRLEAPYASNCTTSWDQTIYTVFNMTTKIPYSIQRCKRYCLQLKVIERCGCFDPLYIESDSDKLGKDPCKLTEGDTNAECISNITLEFDSFQSTCECTPACNQSNYEITISNSKWPSDQYENVAIKTYMSELVNDEQPGEIDAEMKSKAAGNLLHVNVYFRSLDNKRVEENGDYATASDLASALGGVFSLFLGISFCGLFELVEFVIDFFLNVFMACGGRPIGRDNLP